MKKMFITLLATIPFFAAAYNSVVMNPADTMAVLPINTPEESQEFFGKLNDFPHTFNFAVTHPQSFKAKVFVPDDETQNNDVAIIIVKAEKRGVSEIGRTHSKEIKWESSYDKTLAESFRDGGELAGEIEPGIYTLEVSSPDNDGKYRLVWGTEEISYGYFTHLRVLFEVKKVFDHSVFGVLFSPLIYWPLLIFISLFLLFIFKKRFLKIT